MLNPTVITRMIGLFFLGLLALNPPIITLFDAGPDLSLFGIPVFFIYIFGAWATLIGLAATAMRSRR